MYENFNSDLFYWPHLIATVLEFLYLIATLSSLLIASPCNLTVIRCCLMSVVILWPYETAYVVAIKRGTEILLPLIIIIIIIDHYYQCSSQSWALSKFILFNFKKLHAYIHTWSGTAQGAGLGGFSPPPPTLFWLIKSLLFFTLVNQGSIQ